MLYPYITPNQRGFTLLEVLIAIGITALIGLGTWQLLGGTIKAQEITQKNSERFEQLQKMMLIMSRDLQQINSRAIRDEYGDFQPAISNRNRLFLLEFTRSGWRNPMSDPRSDLQRVSYELVDGELLRHYWSVLDRPQDSESVYQSILTDIDTMSFRFMNNDKQWIDSWPPEQTDTDDASTENYMLPKAIEVTVEHNYFGPLVRLYDLPQFVQVKANQQSAGSDSDSGSDDESGNQTNDAQESQQTPEGDQ